MKKKAFVKVWVDEGVCLAAPIKGDRYLPLAVPRVAVGSFGQIEEIKPEELVAVGCPGGTWLPMSCDAEGRLCARTWDQDLERVNLPVEPLGEKPEWDQPKLVVFENVWEIEYGRREVPPLVVDEPSDLPVAVVWSEFSNCLMDIHLYGMGRPHWLDSSFALDEVLLISSAGTFKVGL